MTPARFRWGVLFILIGVLLLLVNTDVLDEHFWLDFIYFIPYLLIAIGIEKIFAHTRFKAISYLTSVGLFAAGLYIAFSSSQGGTSSGFFKSQIIREEADPSIKQVNAVLRLEDAGLTIRDATDDLLYGRFGEWTYKPKYECVKEGERAMIELWGPSESHRFWGGTVRVEGDEPGDWFVSFSRVTLLALECYGDESDIHLNLSTTPLRDLKIDAQDSEIYLKLGNLEPLVTVNARGVDSRLRLRVPTDSGLRLTGVNDPDYLGTVGLTCQGEYFTTAGYDTTANRIDVQLDDQFRSLSIDFY